MKWIIITAMLSVAGLFFYVVGVNMVALETYEEELIEMRTNETGKQTYTTGGGGGFVENIGVEDYVENMITGEHWYGVKKVYLGKTTSIGWFYVFDRVRLPIQVNDHKNYWKYHWIALASAVALTILGLVLETFFKIKRQEREEEEKDYENNYYA